MKFLDGGLDIALVKNNARLGAQIAVSLSHLREESRKGDFHSSVILLFKLLDFVFYAASTTFSIHLQSSEKNA